MPACLAVSSRGRNILKAMNILLPGDWGYDKKLKTWRMEDLPMMPERFKLVVIPQTRGQFQAVKSLIERKDVGEIIIATDAGREGELVARWILAKAGKDLHILRMRKSMRIFIMLQRRERSPTGWWE